MYDGVPLGTMPKLFRTEAEQAVANRIECRWLPDGSYPRVLTRAMWDKVAAKWHRDDLEDFTPYVTGNHAVDVGIARGIVVRSETP